MRMWGIQYCKNEDTDILTSFRIETALQYGKGPYIDLTALGPAVDSKCNRVKFSNPPQDYVKKIVVHLNQVVVGLGLTVGERSVTFGLTGSQEIEYTFSEAQPLIGLYGFEGSSFINGIGFITLDLTSDC